MHSPTGIGRTWRRFNRKFGSAIFVAFIVLVIIAIVGFVMYALSSMNWRPRWQ